MRFCIKIYITWKQTNCYECLKVYTKLTINFRFGCQKLSFGGKYVKLQLGHLVKIKFSVIWICIGKNSFLNSSGGRNITKQINNEFVILYVCQTFLHCNFNWSKLSTLRSLSDIMHSIYNSFRACYVFPHKNAYIIIINLSENSGSSNNDRKL